MELSEINKTVDQQQKEQVVLRPKVWSSFAFQASEINLALMNIQRWRLQAESAEANHNAFLIVQSVSFGGRIHSYVASEFFFFFLLKKTLDNISFYLISCLELS